MLLREETAVECSEVIGMGWRLSVLLDAHTVVWVDSMRH